MTRGELLKLLTEEARRYREAALESIERNGHMNDVSQEDVMRLKEDPGLTQRLIDALLVDFINTIGVGQCVDYALYTRDLESEPDQAPFDPAPPKRHAGKELAKQVRGVIIRLPISPPIKREPEE